ncbi:hypothetical protein MK489_10380 [Myxococcota bacterium]|nr:hypothetical protein [Myxococcota bacterium]
MSLRTPETLPRRRVKRLENRYEQGSALLVSMALLAVMGLIGFSSLETVTRDRQTAGFQSRAQTALYAADAGVSDGLEILKNEVVGSALAPGDCLEGKLAATSLANGTSYGPDSTAPTDEICMLASADPCSSIDASVEVGQPIYLNTIWNIRTEGTAAGGASARIHATARRCHAFNN